MVVYNDIQSVVCLPHWCSQDRAWRVSDSPLRDEHHRVSLRTAARLRIGAIVVSWFSVLFSFSTGVAALGNE